MGRTGTNTRPARGRGPEGRTVLLAALALAVAAASPPRAHAAEDASRDVGPPPTPLSLEWCLAEAQRRNPEIAVDEAGADAARRRIRPAGSLEDPRIGYTASNVPVEEWDFDSTMMSGHQLELRQKLPWPGLLGRRRDAASAAASAAEETVEDRRRRVASAVERAWAGLGFAQRALDITQRNVDLMRQLAQIAEAKYRVGAGLQQDVMRAQVELTRLLEEQLRREAALRATEARLAALLDRSVGDGFPRTLDLADPAPVPDLAGLADRLPETSPRLRALAQRIDEAEQAREAEKWEGLPDVDVVLGYRIREGVDGDPVKGQDFFSGGLTVRLPVDRGKWHERVAERDALVRRAKAEYRAERVRLDEALRVAHADLVRADAEVALLATGLVPQARQSLEASRSGYRVDKVDFPSLIDSQVKLLDAELRQVAAQAERRAAFAALEGAFGEDLR